jgi:DNA-binding CsgD family transcriptional regulator
MVSWRQTESSNSAILAQGGWDALDESLNGTGASLSRLLSTSTVGIALFDANLRCQAINSVLSRMTGVSAKKIVGKPIDQIFPSAAQRLETALRRVWANGDSMSNVELTAPLPANTEPRRWLLNLYPIRDGRAQVRLVAATLFEVTKGRCVEMKLCRLQDRFRSEALRRPGLLEEEFSELSARTFELVNRSVALLRTSVSLRCYVSETRLEARLVPLALSLTVARHQESVLGDVLSTAESGTGPSTSPGTLDEGELHAGGPSFRERQVLRLLADGKSNKEIAVALELATRTVEAYRARIMIKLGLHSTAALVRYAIREKIIEA